MGPTGLAETIRIRNTATFDPGANAQVIDVTGSPNHVLDFVIPRGERGEQGEQGLQGEQGEQGAQGFPGERGLQGEPGVADRISIRETITGEEGTDAIVEDDFTMGVHNLTFTIPKGDSAPVSNLSIAQLYKTTAQTFNAVGQSVDFSINQNFRNSLTTQQTIQVLQGGAYKIEFGLNFSSLTDVVTTLFINDLDMTNTHLQFNDTIMSSSGVFLVVLDANDELSIRVSQITGDAVLADGVLNAYLVVTPAG